MEKAPRNEENAAAIRYIEGHQAHSDLGIILEAAGRRIAGVEIDSSHGRKPFPAIGLLYQRNYFAVVIGMRHLTLRLPPDHAELLLSYGAFVEESIGFPSWISFDPFGLNLDVDVWVEEAFRYSSQ